MANPITKVISANDVKHGNVITHVNKKGTITTLAPPLLRSSTGLNLDARFDNPRFYGGDSNGLQTTTTYTVAASADDGKASTAYKSSSSNSTYTTSFANSSSRPYIGANYDDEEMEWQYTASFVRFDNIVAAQGATIQSAYLKLNKRAYSGTTNNHDFYVAAIDDDDKAALTTASQLNHSNFTTAEVAWGINTDTGNGTIRSAANGTILKSPDIKTVIQEIVDRSGWSSGNAIVLMVYVKAAPTGASTMVQFEHIDDTGSVTPQLEITV